MDVTGNERIYASLFCAISHDMRTPLTSIIGHSVALQQNWAVLSDPEKLVSVSKIYEDAEWLFRMIEDLLAVTYLRENDLTLQTKEELVEEVVSGALDKLEERFPGRNIQVRLPSGYIFLPMNALLIKQVIMNLLENALFCSGSTKPVEILVEDGPDIVSFIVRSFSTGIPEKRLETLFDGTSFTASHAADAQKGMGMRLATCQVIVDAHRGTLETRKHSQGAEFIFTLPKIKENKEKG